MSQYREVVELLPCYLGSVAQRGRGDGPLQIQFQLKGTDRSHGLTGKRPVPVSSSNLSAICQTVMTSTVRVDARGARGAQGAWKGGGGLYDAARHAALSSVLSPCSRPRGPPCR